MSRFRLSGAMMRWPSTARIIPPTITGLSARLTTICRIRGWAALGLQDGKDRSSSTLKFQIRIRSPLNVVGLARLHTALYGHYGTAFREGTIKPAVDIVRECRFKK